MEENNDYIVDVGSFSISEEVYNKVNSMTTGDQRRWLCEQVINGHCDIDQINK
jgi:hypothetical protein|tara:strand:- start:727 stop:885 length:159 start_codon:yes stop_codon:yes gene_type:complete